MFRCEGGYSVHLNGHPRRPTVLVVGPLPPPLNGMTVMTAYALAAFENENVPHEHLDSSDHREVGNVGRFDLRNIWLAFQHWIELDLKLRRGRPDLVYLPVAQSTLGFLRDALFFAAASRHSTPVVVHLHGAAFGEFYRRTSPLMRWVVRSCLRNPERVIVLGESLRDVFTGLVEDRDVVVVPNGVPEVPPISDQPHGPRATRIVFLSNLSLGKGYQDVLGAARAVVNRHPDAYFTLAGEWARPRDATRVRNWLKQEGIADRVSIRRPVVGLRKEELLRSADIFVFPPRQLEGQPVVLLEAMSHGLPVITTARGGIRDTVRAGKTAIIVPPGDPEALAEAIDLLITNPDLKHAMGRAGRALYEECFTQSKFQTALGEAVAPRAWARKGAGASSEGIN